MRRKQHPAPSSGGWSRISDPDVTPIPPTDPDDPDPTEPTNPSENDYDGGNATTDYTGLDIYDYGGANTNFSNMDTEDGGPA